MTKTTKENIIKQVRDEEVRFINLQFTDIVGMVKSITVPVSQLGRVLTEGIWFDGSSIEGFARISESDMFLEAGPGPLCLDPVERAGSSAHARPPDLRRVPRRRPRFLGAHRRGIGCVACRSAEMGFSTWVARKPGVLPFEPDPTAAHAQRHPTTVPLL